MKGIIISFVIIVLLVIGIGYLYYTIEKPFQDKAEFEFFNASFISHEVDMNGNKIKPVKTELQIVTQDNPNQIYKTLITEKEGYVHSDIPTNVSFRIFNKNEFPQIYYTKRYSYLITQPQNIRINVDLERIGYLNISQKGSIEDDNLNLTLTVHNGTFRFVNFCYRWGSGIISVDSSEDYVVGNVPVRLQGLVDRCYQTYRSLLNEGESIEIPFYIKKWNNENIGIKVYIMDGDIRWNSINENNNGLDSYLIELDGKDIGKEDIVYEIRSVV